MGSASLPDRFISGGAQDQEAGWAGEPVLTP